MSIEPDWLSFFLCSLFLQKNRYIPIIPMALVNGSEGIGTGWSTFSFNYNPKDIVENLLVKLQSNRDFQEMQPWYKGFTVIFIQFFPYLIFYRGKLKRWEICARLVDK